MREDFIAELTPFANLLPGALRDRFRLELLRPGSALDAAREPARQAGIPFGDGVAEELVDNLRRAQKGRPQDSDDDPEATGDGEPVLSELVEPVHLQVVCHQLWEGLDDDRVTIKSADLRRWGDVDEALKRFYVDGLRRVLERVEIPEHRLRGWFEGPPLITPDFTRGLVFCAEAETGGLPNAAVEELEDAYLIRKVLRGRDKWYELAHDRLVEPIRSANQAWRAKLRPLTAAALAWEEAGRDEGKLYSGGLLKEARIDAKKHPDRYSALEQKFLEVSAAEERAAIRRRRRQLGTAISVAVVLALLAVLLYFQRAVAISRELAAQSTLQLEEDPELGTLLALEAVNRYTTHEAEHALRKALLQPWVTREWTDASLRIRERFSPAGDLVAVRKGDEIVISEVATGEEQWRRRAERLTWGVDGKYLAAISAKRVEVVDTATWQQRGKGIVLDDRSTLLALAPDGERVAIGIDTNQDEFRLPDQVTIRDLATGDLLQGPLDQPDILTALFSPNGELLVTTSSERWKLWSMRTATAAPVDSGNGHGAAFYAEGKRLLVVASGSVRTFGTDTQPPSLLHECILFDESDESDESEDSDYFVDAALSPDESQIVAGTNDGTIRIFRLERKCVGALPIVAHETRVHSVAFNPDGDLLLTASEDRSAAIWTTRGQLLARLPGHRERVLQASFILKDKRSNEAARQLQVLTATPSQSRLWSANVLSILEKDGPKANRIQLSEDGHSLVVRSTSQARVLETVAGREIASPCKRTLPAEVDAKLPDTGDPVLDCGNVRTAILSPDGLRLAIAGDSAIWVQDLEERSIRELPDPDGVKYLALSSDSTRLLSTSTSGAGTAKLWDWRAKQELHSFEHKQITGAAFSNHGRIVTTGRDKKARIWSLETGAVLEVLSHSAAVFGASFDPTGRRVVTACKDGIVRLWKSADRPAAAKRLSADELYGASFSPDGRTVLVWGYAEEAYLWRPERDNAHIVLPGHIEVLGSPSFDAAGQLVFTFDRTRTRIWDAVAPDGPLLLEMALVRASRSQVNAVTWSANGLRLALARDDGQIEVYDCEACRPLEQAGELARRRLKERTPERALTSGERRRYLHER